jgi:hypothetical protein
VDARKYCYDSSCYEALGGCLHRSGYTAWAKVRNIAVHARPEESMNVSATSMTCADGYAETRMERQKRTHNPLMMRCHPSVGMDDP